LGGTGSKGLPWSAFAALSLGMMVYGLAESYGPVTYASGLTKNAWLSYGLPFVFGGIGALLAGYLSDRLGRRRAFILTGGLLLLGLLLYIPVYLNWTSSALGQALLVASIAIVGMTAIGLETPILAAIAEGADPQGRSKMLVLAQNFGNLGVALAFVPLVLLHGQAAQTVQVETALLLMYLAPTVALIIAFLRAFESLPWIAARTGTIDVKEAWKQVDGGAAPVQPTAGLGARFATLLTIGIAQDVAFVYVTYGAASFFTSTFSGLSASSLAPMVGGFVMTIVGVLTGLFIAHRVERRPFALLSFALQAVFWAALAVAAYLTGFTMSWLMLALFVLNFVTVELTWASRALLEPELFPTKVRGLYISLVRMSVWVITGVITGLMTNLNPLATDFTAAALVMGLVAVAGAAGAAFWRFYGFETANRSLVGLDLHHIGPIAERKEARSS